MPEEEVLGEEDAVQEEVDDTGDDEGEGGMGGLFSLEGGLNSTLVQILLGTIGVVALVFIVIGAVWWTNSVMVSNTKPEEEKSVEKKRTAGQEPLKYFPLKNDFVITKQTPSGRTRTLKASIYLAFPADQASTVKSELKARKPQIRDLITGILGSKNVEELRYDNRQQLKDEIVNEVNKILTRGGRVQKVFFNEYVFQ
ncbi:MAG: flagellar basal body-associated protein FliL [bacterium]